MEKRKCTKCGKSFPLENFHRNKNSEGGRRYWCKKCVADYHSEYAKKPDNAKKIKARSKTEIAIESRRISKLKSRYGITAEDYDRMLSEQNGVCSICGDPEVIRDCGKERRLAVDHCHKTGIVRGLLCHNCNRALGHFQDNIDVLASAISYLKQFEEVDV